MHRKRGKSARASPTPHHTLNEERSARFTAQPLSALTETLNFLVTHYFYGGIVVCAYPIFCFLCSCSLLFFTAAHFHLAGR